MQARRSVTHPSIHNAPSKRNAPLPLEVVERVEPCRSIGGTGEAAAVAATGRGALPLPLVLLEAACGSIVTISRRLLLFMLVVVPPLAAGGACSWLLLLLPLAAVAGRISTATDAAAAASCPPCGCPWWWWWWWWWWWR